MSDLFTVSGDRRLIKRWQTRGGKWWVNLYKSPQGFSYTMPNGGGSFGTLPYVTVILRLRQRMEMSLVIDNIKYREVTITRRDPAVD